MHSLTGQVMKLRSGVTFALLFAVLSVLASRGLGQVNAPEGQGYGLGMHSCSEFARSYAANPSVTEDLYFTWAQGFMSGLNLMLQVNSSRARNLSHSGMISQKLQLRSYCDAHPLAQYAEAVFALYQALPVVSK